MSSDDSPPRNDICLMVDERTSTSRGDTSCQGPDGKGFFNLKWEKSILTHHRQHTDPIAGMRVCKPQEEKQVEQHEEAGNFLS